jgi:Ca-activated chloride channel family protein
MTFAEPAWLLLFLILPLWLRIRSRRSEKGFILPQWQGSKTPWRSRVRMALPWLQILAFGLLILAMARPQRNWTEQVVRADAIDIMMALDISPSMLSTDFNPDRLTVAKAVLNEFVDNRPYDRIGLTAFAAEAFTQCPLTTDKRIVKQYVNELQVGRVEDGTAIGMGLSTAINRIKDSESKTKVIILVTDGENNAGYITPLQAADIAQTLNIRVYTVGIGTEGSVYSPIRPRGDGSYDFAHREVIFDTKLLEDIAQKTKGKFYRAYSPDDLQEIYAEIDQLEKTKIDITSFQKQTELGPWLALLALALLVVQWLLRWSWLRSLTDAV